MQILKFHDFAALPAGAIYSYYKPSICEGLFRKGETIWNEGEASDFFESSLVPDCWNGELPTVDNVESRWGMFDYDQLFAVFEPQDLKTIRDMIPSANTDVQPS